MRSSALCCLRRRRLRLEPSRRRACGKAGNKPCPLPAFMRDELARPYAERRLDELGASLERLAGFNPDPAGWQGWAEFAADAARAARAHRKGGDPQGVLGLPSPLPGRVPPALSGASAGRRARLNLRRGRRAFYIVKSSANQ